MSFFLFFASFVSLLFAFVGVIFGLQACTVRRVSLHFTDSVCRRDGDSASVMQTYFAPTGFLCFPCPPGTLVSDHCRQDLTNSTCTECPTLQYSDQPNTLGSCNACKTWCPANSQEVQSCNRTTNRRCVCDEGYHQHFFDNIDEWDCKPHRTCKEEEGVLQYGGWLLLLFCSCLLLPFL